MVPQTDLIFPTVRLRPLTILVVVDHPLLHLRAVLPLRARRLLVVRPVEAVVVAPNLMTEEQFQILKEESDRDIRDRPDEIDAECELDWHALTIGWAIAKGLSPQEAKEYSYRVRY